MGSELTIRSATGDDAAAVAGIYAPYVERTAISFERSPPDAAGMRGRIERVLERYPWRVAERVGRVVGYAYATSFRAREAYRFTVETSVYVALGQGGSGVGTALMRDLLERLRAQGFRRVIAGATLPNAGSTRLHEALGFTPVGVFREVGRKSGAWHDVGFWELALAGDDGEPREPLPPDHG